MQSTSLNAVWSSYHYTKDGEAPIWQGCKFTLNRKMPNDTRYWRCGKRICPARITTADEVLQHANKCMEYKLKWKE